MRDTKLQTASRLYVEKYHPFLTHMLTLNLLDSKVRVLRKGTGWNVGSIERKELVITDAAAYASLHYFIEVLNYMLHGRRTRKPRYMDVCRIIAIPVYEGAMTDKHRHFHILLGNVPADKLNDLQSYVEKAWAKTRWSMPGVHITELFDTDGAAFYTGKEVGYYNNDAVVWELASIPRRLLGATA